MRISLPRFGLVDVCIGVGSPTGHDKWSCLFGGRWHECTEEENEICNAEAKRRGLVIKPRSCPVCGELI